MSLEAADALLLFMSAGRGGLGVGHARVVYSVSCKSARGPRPGPRDALLLLKIFHLPLLLLTAAKRLRAVSGKKTNIRPKSFGHKFLTREFQHLETLIKPWTVRGARSGASPSPGVGPASPGQPCTPAAGGQPR